MLKSKKCSQDSQLRMRDFEDIYDNHGPANKKTVILKSKKYYAEKR